MVIEGEVKLLQCRRVFIQTIVMRVTADFDMNSFVILENYSSYLGLGFPYKIRDLKKKINISQRVSFPKAVGNSSFWGYKYTQ